MSDACKACGEEWNPSTLRENNMICPNCHELDITCPLVLIDEHGPKRVCGTKLIMSDGKVICPDCEESFTLIPTH